MVSSRPSMPEHLQAPTLDSSNTLPDVFDSKESRRFQRVKVTLLGRYMLSDKREFPCQITEMSPGSAMIIAPVTGSVGEKVIAYIDLIGRVEGTITRAVDDGFAIDIKATVDKRDQWSSQLTWLANKDDVGLEEDRRHERHMDNRHSKLCLPDGRNFDCKVLDVSLSGVAIQIDERPALGTPVVIGRVKGRVVRHFEEGVAIEFAVAQQVLSVAQRTVFST